MPTERTPTTLRAACQTCKWKRREGKYDAVRMAARRHAESKGHLVHGYTERTLVWDGREQPDVTVVTARRHLIVPTEEETSRG